MHLVKRISPKVFERAFVAIDVENDPFTGSFLHAHLYSEHIPVDLHFTDQHALEEWLMSQHNPKSHHKSAPFMLIGFNFRYDSPFLTRILDDKKTLWAEGRFITGRLKNGIRLMDLMNHIDSGQSLADWIGYLGMEEKYGIKKLPLTQLAERNRFDTMATFYLGDFFQKMYVNELGIPMKLTVGSSALCLFLSRFFNHYWCRSDDQQWLNDYERQALRGGRTECFQRGKIRHSSYDVNSTYLSIMRENDFPDPMSAHFVRGNKDFERHLAEHELIAHCAVDAPKSKIMVLPWYDPKTKKLLFPCGQFEGYWCSHELREAIKQGYKIIKVFDYIYYSKVFPYFRDFAEFVWEKRLEYKAQANAGMDKLIKKIGNTCYGKFGQANALSGFWGKLSDFDEDITGKETKITKIGGVEYISVPSGERADALHTFPVIPVFIAALARLKLYRAMKANEEYTIYCDTDSIKLRSNPKGIVIGKNLGEWSFEGIFEQVFYKAKWYGEKLKGVPKRAVKTADTRDYAEFLYDRPIGFKQSIRTGEAFNVWREMPKRVSKIDDKRIWNGRYSEPLQVCYNDFRSSE